MEEVNKNTGLDNTDKKLHISDVISSKILCRTCAAYGGCKLDKKGTATKCRNFWEHRSTSDFI